MLKRRYYKEEHGDGDDPSSSSSSSSEDEKEEEYRESENEGGDDDDGDYGQESLPKSGYESEESSGKEIDCDPAGGVKNEKEDTADGRKNISAVVRKSKNQDSKADNKLIQAMDSANPDSAINPSHAGLSDHVLRLKSILKCKLCPRIVCLSQDMMRTHLNSKRHARSEKLFKEGRLKLMLNDDGDIEEEAETHAERYARLVADAQNAIHAIGKKGKGRQRQRKRSKKKESLENGTTKRAKESTTGRPKHKKLKARGD